MYPGNIVLTLQLESQRMQHFAFFCYLNPLWACIFLLSFPSQSQRYRASLVVYSKMAASVIHATLARNNITYYQLLAETMSDVSNNLIPTHIQELFLPLSRVHSYSTRSSTSQNFYRKKSNLEIKKTLSQDLVPNYGMRYQPSCAHFQNTNSNLIYSCIIAWYIGD